MDAISKLADIDPVFVEVAKALYPDLDPRQLHALSKMHDSSEVHVDGAPKKRNKGAMARAALGGGLALGTVAEADGAYHATKEAAGAIKLARIAGTAVPKMKVARAGLQVANMGVGLAGAAALLKPRKKTPAEAPAGSTVAKGVRLRPVKVKLSDEAAHQIRDNTARAITNGRRTFAVVTAGGAGAAGYVAAGADKRKLKFASKLSKSVAHDFTWTGEISKMDEDKRQVFGWCSLSTVDGLPVVDLQGDYVPIEEIEKSAYHYVINSRKGGDMHRRVPGDVSKADAPLHTSDLVESFVVTKEKLSKMGLPEDALPEGWWVGFKVNDDATWRMVKDGKRTGFSIHGTGTRKELAA